MNCKNYWGNLNWQEAVHNEDQSEGTLSVQSNDCWSSEKALLTSYDINIVMTTRKRMKKLCNLIPKHKLFKNQNFKS